ncbi:hypothetical protein ACIQVC_16805 [Streptomyces sp. NPDC101112]|uniref:hypothetical protein n=1 Tax=Streptomyces sp. NPDC101112 TaxID=3366105 RepID=UPI00382602CF
MTVLSAAGSTLLLLATTSGAGLPWIAAALFLTACPVGLILPTTTALCLQRAPHAAGSVSAVLGTTQFLMGALAPALCGLGGQGTALPVVASVRTRWPSEPGIRTASSSPRRRGLANSPAVKGS